MQRIIKLCEYKESYGGVVMSKQALEEKIATQILGEGYTIDALTVWEDERCRYAYVVYSDSDSEFEAEPYTWNDNKSKEALEVFNGLELRYRESTILGQALAKLEMIENGELLPWITEGLPKVNELVWATVFNSDYGKVVVRSYVDEKGSWHQEGPKGEVVAWMPFTVPYGEDIND